MKDDFSVERFAASFSKFLEFVQESTPEQDATEAPKAAARVTEFLGAPAPRLAIAKASYKLRDLPTVQLSVEALLREPGWDAELLGYSIQHDMNFSMGTVLAPSSYDPVREGPPVYSSTDLPDRRLSCLEQGLYLVTGPWGRAALLQHVERGYREPVLHLQAAATEPTVAERLIERVGELARELSVLKRAVISLGADSADDVVFHRIATLARDELILPADVLAAVERTTLGLSEHTERLLAAGRHLKRGLLLHGPPGTGKSSAVRYLIGQMPERTVIILTGRVLGLIKMSCELARQLAPATVVLEDVDLVAEDRTREPTCAPLLFELMNEMDGLPGDADILFLLTTNRPDVLEPALAARPGRIDQAIEFPLPNAECRRRLFDLYGRGLDMSRTDITDLVGRTEGVSPAFIKELLRRAALNAAARTPGMQGLEVSNADVVDALREIVVTGGVLTQRLLGATEAALHS